MSRKLDAEVAKKVMGWNNVIFQPNGWLMGVPPEQPHNFVPTPVKRYSEHLDSVWEVVEEIMKKGFIWKFFKHPDCWSAEIFVYENDFRTITRAEGKTFPVAICKAALELAKGKW